MLQFASTSYTSWAEKGTTRIVYYRDYPEESPPPPLLPPHRGYTKFLSREALRGVTHFSNTLPYLFEFSFHLRMPSIKSHEIQRDLLCFFLLTCLWRNKKKNKKVFRSDLNRKKCHIIRMYLGVVFVSGRSVWWYDRWYELPFSISLICWFRIIRDGSLKKRWRQWSIFGSHEFVFAYWLC